MRDPAPSQSAASPASFAKLLASLTGAESKSADVWDTSALEDDVASISYEQALRAHQRVRTPEPTVSAPATSGNVAPVSQARIESKKKVPKSASITVRLDAAERAQLQERAAEAGLSVSAYLRSCIFEAESLRAQVKEALSQMRATSPQQPLAAPAPPVSHRRFHFLPSWSAKRNISR